MSENEFRVQDDLYNFINHDWLEKAEIPDDKPVAGGFSNLDTAVEKLMMTDFRKMASGDLTINDPNIQKAVLLYKVGLDINKRNNDGIKPIVKYLDKIENLTDINDLNNNITEFVLKELPLPFQIEVDANMKDTRHNCVMLSGVRTILPDTTYYKEEMAQQKAALFNIWQKMVNDLLDYTNLTNDQKAEYISDAIKFDEIIATLVKSSEEMSEYPKLYNPMKTSRVASLLKPLNFKNILKALFEKIPEEVIVFEPLFVKGFKTLFCEENFNLYKHWAYIKMIIGNVDFLSEELREKGSLYFKTLSGVTSVASIDKQAYKIASHYFSEPVGYYYGKKYFGEVAKNDVIEMVKEIIATYQDRIKNNDFLSPETKDKAILKLRKMVIKMGYPDSVDNLYDKLFVDENKSLFDNIILLKEIISKNNYSKLYKDYDRERWVMPGHMVNACYNPFSNDITFPAAILQAPFYSIKQSRSENLGGIGAVIGHEISHAFDNNGAKCDENGNLNNWWTKEDFKQFKLKTKSMIKQFDGIDVGYGKVNGTFVVSENIADNGGMAVTLEIMKSMEDPNYKEYFYNWARVWCLKIRPEFAQLLLSVDVHAPAILRANMPPRNFDEWYETFKVKRTDKMYLAPKKRVNIW